MASRKSSNGFMRGAGPRGASIGAGHMFVGAAAALVACAVWLIPAPLLTPALSVAAIALALTVAAVAFATNAPRGGERITAWDVAGALAFVGFAAAMLSKPDSLVGFLNVATAAQSF